MLQITMPCDRLLVTDTANYLLQLATTYGLPQSDANAFLFLLESIIELRTLEPSEKDPVLTIDVELKRGRFVVSVTDKGLPYMLTDNQKKILKAGHVDRFRFEQLGVGGQRITLEFRLGTNNVEPQIPEPQMEELLDRNFSCRLTRDIDQDIVEVIRCIY
ncbi:MAG: hypothetical protein Q4B54_11640, partial [Coriobacteriales bacterium]|nr:hypothetical protein [Coriobacteriales bacterium]